MTDTTAGEGVALLPCPFCAGKDVVSEGFNIFSVRCRSCGASTAPRETASNAEGNWNFRALAAQPSAGAKVRGDLTEAQALSWFEKTGMTPSEIVAALATPAKPDTGDVAALREALTWIRDTNFLPNKSVSSWSTTEAENDMGQGIVAIQRLATDTLAALSKPTAPGREG